MDQPLLQRDGQCQGSVFDCILFSFKRMASHDLDLVSKIVFTVISDKSMNAAWSTAQKKPWVSQ